jgi:hypothetical protein
MHAAGYNFAVSMADARRVGVVILVVLFAIGLLLAHAPRDLGAVRVGGVGLLWWYSTLAGPLVAVLVVIASHHVGRRPTRSDTVPTSRVVDVRAIAIWTSPVTFTAIAASVFWADANAPLLILAVALAPLLAVLQVPEEEAARPGMVVTGVGLLSVGLVVWAHLLVVGDLSSALGMSRWRALVAVAVAAFVLAQGGRRGARWTPGVPLGLACLAVPVSLVAAAAGAPPWAAWTKLSSMATLSFSPGSAWVTEGRSVARPTDLTFVESHRVTATAAGVYRVTERDGPAVTVREWGLAAGDVLELRPGDQLSLPAGARVRFESGRRVPGLASSGVIWADPPARRRARSIVEALGFAVTLAGGATALIRPLGRHGSFPVAVPAMLLIFTMAAASWGVYAAYLGLDLGLGATSLLPLLEAPSLALDVQWRRPFIASMTVGLFTLSITALCGVQARVAQLWGRPRLPGRPGQGVDVELLHGAVFAGALVLSFWPGDAWRVLLAGLGLAASTWLVACVAPDDPGMVAGALVAVAVFAALGLGAEHLASWAAPFGLYPVLAAAPLGAVTAVGVRGRRAAVRALRA